MKWIVEDMNMFLRGWASSLATFPAAISTPITSINVNQAAFLPGNQLVTVLSNGTATVWDLNPAREIRRLCSTTATPAMASRR